MDDRTKMNEGMVEDKEYGFDEFNELERDVAKATTHKSRTNYGTGLRECFENCKCASCKRAKKGAYSETNKNKDVTTK